MLQWPCLEKENSKTGSVEEVDQPLPTISLSDESGTNIHQSLKRQNQRLTLTQVELYNQQVRSSDYGSSTHLSEEKRQRANSTLSSTSFQSSSSTSYYSADGESFSGSKLLTTAKANDNNSFQLQSLRLQRTS